MCGRGARSERPEFTWVMSGTTGSGQRIRTPESGPQGSGRRANRGGTAAAGDAAKAVGVAFAVREPSPALRRIVDLMRLEDMLAVE
jgi:hypothetical protein